MSLLSALICNGPRILWAVLQREGQWCQWIERDLDDLARIDSSWPAAGSRNWERWSAQVQASPATFKRRVKAMLRHQHSVDIAHQKTVLALWAMHRLAVQGSTVRAGNDDRWKCRMCKKAFRSKGGLGAHMFKTHGRAAAYRAVVQGTRCPACGVEYWSHPRLSVHLRDTPWCTNTLRTRRWRAPQMLPGFGSKGWHAKEVDQFTPAPPTRVAEPTWIDGEVMWSDEANRAYKDLCFVLFDVSEWRSRDQVIAAITAVLELYPLYEVEEIDVLDYVRGEVRSLRDENPELIWDDQATAIVLDALCFEHVAFEVDGGDRGRPSDLTLKAFEKTVQDINWPAAIETGRQSRGTLNPQSCTLHIEWEANGSLCRDGGKTPAAASEPADYIPERLRKAWEHILLGTANAISAPSRFWDTPFAAPFAALRAPASN